MPTPRKITLTIGASLLLMSATACGAPAGAGDATEKFPTETIQVVVPYDAGGETDIFARHAFDTAEKEGLLENFVIKNKPGGSSAVGHKYVDTQSGNDHLLLSSASTLITGSLLSKETPDFGAFTPIAQIGSSAGIWAVAANSPIQTVDDLVKAGKEERGITVAIGALGTLDHSAVLKLADSTQGKFVPIPNESSGAAIVQTLNNSADVVIANPSTVIGHVQSGALRMLATSAEAPIPGLDVPTFKSLGHNIQFATPKAIMAPAGISETAKKYYVEAFEDLVKTQVWKDYLKTQYLSESFLFGDDLAASLKETQEDMRPLFKAAGLG